MTQGDEAPGQAASNPNGNGSVSSTGVWAWTLIGLALLIQYGLFHQYALREVVWSYPAAHDQTFYLSISYDTYEHISNEGLLNGLRYGVGLPAIGLLLHLQASLLYFALGPGRLTALTLNFLYFALLQLALAATLRWLTRRWSIVAVGLGLLLCALTPFAGAGGLMDFRMDFVATCVFGILLCAVLRSEIFASPRWSLVVGILASYLIVLRFITAVYLTGIAGLFVAALLIRMCWLRGDTGRLRLEWRRLLHMGMASLVVAAVVLPIMCWRADVLKRYYVEGHVTGEEKHIRALMDGHELLYYPRSLLQDHAGSSFSRIAALLFLATAAFGAARLIKRRWDTSDEMLPSRKGFLGLALVLLALCLIVPTLILTIDLHRSPVVGQIMLVPLLWLIVLPLSLLARSALPQRRSLLDLTLAILAVVTLATASFSQFSHYGRHGDAARDRPNREQILALHDLLGEAMKQRSLSHAVIATTSNADYLTFEATETLVYERQGYYCTFESPLRKLSAVSREDALACLRGSRVVVLTRPEHGRTPYDQAMTSLFPYLQDYCEKHLTHLKTFRIFDKDIALYIRDGASDGGEQTDDRNEVATGGAKGPLSR